MTLDDMSKLNRLQNSISKKLNEYVKDHEKASLFVEKAFLPSNHEPININGFKGSIGTLASPLNRDVKLDYVDSPFTIIFQTLHQINPNIGFQIAKSSDYFPEFAVLMGSVIATFENQLQGQPFVFFGKGYKEYQMSELIDIKNALVNIAEYGTVFQVLNNKPFKTQWEVMSYENEFVRSIEEEINKNDK